MSDRPLTDLVLVACNLQAASPDFFQQFVDAVRSLEKQAIVKLCAADKSKEIFRAQGEVRALQQLRKHIVECRALRDTYVRRDANART